MRPFKKPRLLLALLSAVGLLALTIACGSASGSETGTPNTTGNVNNVSNVAGSVPQGSSGSVAELARSAAYVDSISYGGYGGLQEGIHVTGTGVVTVDPDLAVLNVGVSATADTVKEAMDQANTALNAMLTALAAHGIESKDIKTTHFSVYPRYDSYEAYACPESGDAAPAPATDRSMPSDGCYREWKQKLTGYQVTNQLTVNIRNVDDVGPVIDDTVAAGGDAAQVHGIYFTVEDTKALAAQAREAAVDAAMDQAQQFASLTEVTLGKLVHISQSGGEMPVSRAEKDLALAPGAEFAPTPIQTGEIEVTVTVQALFAIS